ncbi:MAG: 16S rRNA pseudouridine(516) synthase RsuA [Ketobacter sp.]|uniref:16S rRNA pseudouridine(516) synthase RsuA n=1 Tax=Ketobacter sp. MCCC 1A13808 TaxID=2602738 RepID=UPI0021021D2D|nr:16S rRNA pseudouridine(516) synthase RsuA [Ketobacter sp. MCCC 1A13808]
MSMRLDKFLSHYSGLSRKEAKQAIKAGDVLVADRAVTDPQTKIQPDEAVRLNGMRIQPQGPRYYMLHKPAGYVCANTDSLHPTVMSLLEDEDTESLHVAGRLDLDTTGLVLITDDGQWSHRVTSPKHKLDKLYQVQLHEPINDQDRIQIEQGVLLKDESKRTRPAKIILHQPQQVELIIREGKYHQVKRMFAAVGNHVTTLHRARIGEIELDPSLLPGEYRPLTQLEINSVGAG